MHGRCRAPWKLIVLFVALDDPEPTELERPDLSAEDAVGRWGQGRGRPRCVARPAPCGEEHGARQLGIGAGSSVGAGSSPSSGSSGSSASLACDL